MAYKAIMIHVDEFEPRLEAPVHVTDGGSTGTRATAVDEAAAATRISGPTAAEQGTALHAAGNGRRCRHAGCRSPPRRCRRAGKARAHGGKCRPRPCSRELNEPNQRCLEESTGWVGVFVNWLLPHNKMTRGKI